MLPTDLYSVQELMDLGAELIYVEKDTGKGTSSTWWRPKDLLEGEGTSGEEPMPRPVVLGHAVQQPVL